MVEGENKLVYFEESHHDGIARVHLLFEKSHFVVRDFLKVLGCFRYFFLNGPARMYEKVDEEFDFFSELIRKNWGSHINQVFVMLERFIDGGSWLGLMMAA